jgi:DNA modification methylase
MICDATKVIFRVDGKTQHKIIIWDSTKMVQVNDNSIDLVVTSPPYPMIEI